MTDSVSTEPMFEPDRDRLMVWTNSLAALVAESKYAGSSSRQLDQTYQEMKKNLNSALIGITQALHMTRK